MPSSCTAGEGGPPSERSVLRPLSPGARVRGSMASAGAPLAYRPSGTLSRSWGSNQNTRRRNVPEEREGLALGPSWA